MAVVSQLVGWLGRESRLVLLQDYMAGVQQRVARHSVPRKTARSAVLHYQFSSYLLSIPAQIALGATSTQSSQSDRTLNLFGNLALVMRIGAFATAQYPISLLISLRFC